MPIHNPSDSPEPVNSNSIGIKKHIIGDVRYDNDGQYFFDSENHMIAELRGWGRIQNLFNPATEQGMNDAAKFQDEVGEFISQAINEKLKSLTVDETPLN